MLPQAGAEPQAERLTCLPPGADSAAGSPTIARTTPPPHQNHIGTNKRHPQPLWMGHSTHSPQLLHPKQVAALTLTAPESSRSGSPPTSQNPHPRCTSRSANASPQPESWS